MSEKLTDIKITSTMSKADNCVCDVCNDIGIVMKVSIPNAVRKGKKLVSEQSELWLCCRCRSKLIHALDWPDDTYEKEMKD